MSGGADLTGRAGARRGPRPGGDERGESLIELAIALAVMALVLGMSVVIVTVMVRTSSGGVTQGEVVDSVQGGLGSLSSYLTDMTTPENAVLASASYATPLAVTTTVPASADPLACWGDDDPTDGAATAGLSPQYDSVDFGWDYALQFCAYPPGSTAATPHVYEAVLDPSTCDDATNTCTLEIYDFGTGFAAAQATCDGGSACTLYPDGSGTDPDARPSGASSLAYSIPDVWCDAFCRTGTSCQTDLAEGLSVAGCSSATVGATTPPLFNYYSRSATRQTESAGVAAPVAPAGAFIGTLNGRPPLDFLSAADAADLSTLGTIGIDITFEPSGPTGPGHPNTVPDRITDQIPVAGLG